MDVLRLSHLGLANLQSLGRKRRGVIRVWQWLHYCYRFTCWIILWFRGSSNCFLSQSRTAQSDAQKEKRRAREAAAGVCPHKPSTDKAGLSQGCQTWTLPAGASQKTVRGRSRNNSEFEQKVLDASHCLRPCTHTQLKLVSPLFHQGNCRPG